MTAIAPKKISNKEFSKRTRANIKWVDPKIWKANKDKQYSWAAEEGSKKGYKSPVVKTLEAIIACCDINGSSWASIDVITAKRASLNAGKALTSRSVRTHLKLLSLGGSIHRADQLSFNRPVNTRLLRDNLFSCAQQEETSYLSFSQRERGYSKAANTPAAIAAREQIETKPKTEHAIIQNSEAIDVNTDTEIDEGYAKSMRELQELRVRFGCA